MCLRVPFIVAGTEKREKGRGNGRKLYHIHDNKWEIKIDNYDKQRRMAGGTARHRRDSPSRVSFGGGTYEAREKDQDQTGRECVEPRYDKGPMWPRQVERVHRVAWGVTVIGGGDQLEKA